MTYSPVAACDAPAAIAPLLPVADAHAEAPLVDGTSVRYVNLDYAASAPALDAVTRQLEAALPYYSSVHRGAGYASQVSTALYERSREVIGEFLGARDDDVVVITRNTTDALNLLASAVPADAGDVVVLDVEHHANLLPWRRGACRVVPVASTLAATLAALDAEVASAPTALVAVTGCSNVTGELLPLEQLVAIARRHGARICVDGAQLVPHRRVDIGALGIDYIALSGHKAYAPHGAGALVGRRDWLDAAPAYLAGGGAVREVTADSVEWASAPQRHEGGTPNVLGAVALATAFQTLSLLPQGELAAHEHALAERLRDGLAAVPGVSVLRIWDDSTDQVGVVTFVVEGHDSGRVAAYLSAEHGIGVRDGRFCAHPLVARLGASSGAIRASMGVGSRDEDVDRLVDALAALAAEGEGWSYALDGGRWVPSPDTRRAPGLPALGITLGSSLPASPFEAH